MSKVFIEDFRTGETLKRCSKCGVYKRLGEYNQAKKRAHGVVPDCKECRNKRDRIYRDKNDRFWKYYHSHIEHVGNCVEYTGTRLNGNLSTLRRKIYRLSVGVLNNDDFIITTCDNPQCVKQGHFKKASKIDVEIKRISKLPAGDRNPSRMHPERLARGDRHWSHLHPERILRGDKNPSRMHPERLARGDRHGSKTHPERLRRGHTHPARLHPERLARGEQANKSKLSTEDVRQIRELYSNEKIPQRKLADRFGITQRAIWQIINNKTWKHVQ